MKIAEIVDFVADQEPEAAPISSFKRRIANSLPKAVELNALWTSKARRTERQAWRFPYSHLAASEEGTSTARSADAVQNSSRTVPRASDPSRTFRAHCRRDM